MTTVYSHLTYLLTSLLTSLLTYLSPIFSLISLARPFFLVPAPDIYIRACRTMHIIKLPAFFGSGPLRGAHRHGHRVGLGKEGDGCCV